MHSLPIILACDFDDPTITYRVPIRCARNYWDFAEYLHATFSKPWERYTAHLHLDSDNCGAHLSRSGWDAGSYFDEEFSDQGKLLVYVHFEEMEKARPRPNDDKKAADKEWNWGWAEGTQFAKLDNEEIDRLMGDAYPPFPETLQDDADHEDQADLSEVTNLTRPPVTKPAADAPQSTKVARKSNHAHFYSTSKTPLGIPVGRAKSTYCRDSANPPVVHGTISRNRVLFQIPGKEAPKALAGGKVQIAFDGIEFDEEFRVEEDDRERYRLVVKERVKEKIKGADESVKEEKMEAKREEDEGEG